MGAAVSLPLDARAAAQGHDVLALAAQVAPLEPGYVVPRTPWGDPDIEGKWPSIDMVRVPVERQARYGARLFLTPAEAAEREAGEKVQIERMAAEGAGGATGAPGHWVEWGLTQRQSSLLVDPPDGRMPALTEEGKARLSAAPTGTMGTKPLNGPRDFTMWERCLSRGALGSTLPVLYNSGIDITQGPGFVGIRYEMVHDHRIIPLDRRAAAVAGLQFYVGRRARPLGRRHAGGRVANFTDNKVGLGLSGGGVPASRDLRLVERFTRVGPKTHPLRGHRQRPAHLRARLDGGVSADARSPATACTSTRATRATTG